MKSYFKFLSRNKLYTLIEAVGLSVSLGFVLLLMFFARTELRTGKVRAGADKVYAVGTGEFYGMTKGTAETFFPAIPEIDKWARYIGAYEDYDLTCGGEYFQADIAAADNGFFSLFDLEIDACSREDALRDPGSVLLSRAFAARVFGGESPVGKTVEYGGESFTVAGLVEDFGPLDVFKPKDVWFNFDALAKDLQPMDNFGTVDIFVTLKEDASPEDVSEKLLDAYVGYWDYYDRDGSTGSFIWGSSLTPVEDIYLNSSLSTEWGAFRGGNRGRLNMLAALALVLLVSAVFNYINLTVAQVSKRAPEMAVRRINGDTPAGIRARYVRESLIFTFASGALGVLLAYLVRPFFERTLGYNIMMDLNVGVVSAIIGFLFVISLLCSMIPSALASGFRPLDVVNGRFRLRGKQVFSRMFIVLQCVFSACLLAMAITMFAQIRHLERLPKGYESENLVQVDATTMFMDREGVRALKAELQKVPGVEQVSLCRQAPFNDCGMNGVHEDGAEKLAWIRNMAMEPIGIGMLGLQVAEQYCEPVKGMWYIDRTAARRFGVSREKPWFGGTESNPEYKVCGVLEDFRSGSAMYWPEEESYNGINVLGDGSYASGLMLKVNTHDAAVRKAISEVCSEYCRERYGLPLALSVTYADDMLDSALGGTRNVFALVGLFMIVAIIIASLGILAMSVYYTGQQSRNIAVRKVFGADSMKAAWTLSRSVILQSALAGVISSPICIFMIRRYLQDFYYPVDFPWYAIVLAILITIAVTVLTIAANTWAAASRNPVTALKQNN